MMESRKRFTLVLSEFVSCYLVSAFFLLAASFKLTEASILTRTLARLPWFPEIPTTPRAAIGGAILGLEVYVGCALLLRRQLGLALVIAVILPLIFAATVAPFYEIMGGDCACVWRWVPFRPDSGLALVGRNMVLAATALLSYQLRRERLARSGSESAGPQSTLTRPWLGLLAVGAIAAILWVSVRGATPKVTDRGAAQFPSQAQGQATVPGVVLEFDGSEQRAVASGTRLLTDDRRAAIALSVQSAEKAALPGVEIYAVHGLVTFSTLELETRSRQRPAPLATTDAQGLAPIPVTGDARQLALIGQGLDPKLIHLGSARGDSFTVTMRAANGPRLHVRQTSGEPVRTARVLVGCDSWGWAVPGSYNGYFDFDTTDDAGELRLPTMPRRGLDIVIDWPGSYPRRFRLQEAASNEDIEIVLPDASRVAGRVVPSSVHDLAAIADPVLDGSAIAVSVAVTSGAFAFDSLASGEEWDVSICRRTEGRWEQLSPAMRILPPVSEMTIALASGYSIRVRALNAHGQDTPPTVLSSLFPTESVVTPSTPGGLRQKDGSWMWSDVPAQLHGRRELWVTAEGHLPVSVGIHELREGWHVDLGDVQLGPPAKWEIRAVDSAEESPIAGATVTYFPDAAVVRPPGTSIGSWLQNAVTNPHGTASLVMPQAGRGTLTVAHAGWCSSRLSVEPASMENPTVVRLERPASVLAECKTLDGLPVGRVELSWRSADSSEWDYVCTDYAGTVVIEVPPRRAIELRHARHVARRQVNGVETLMNFPEREDGEAASLRPMTAGEQLKVILRVPVVGGLALAVSLNGRPAEGFRVLALPLPDLDATDSDLWGTLEAPRAVTDADGRCILDDVPLGPATFMISDQRGESTWSVEELIRVGNPVVEVDLRDRRIQVLVRGVAGDPLNGVAVRLAPMPKTGTRFPVVVGRISDSGRTRHRAGKIIATDADGWALFEHIPVDATVNILCDEADRFPHIGPVLVGAGSTDASVELRDGSGAVLDLEIVDDAGLPRPDVRVRLESPGGDSAAVELVSDRNGAVRFPGLRPGEWKVRTFPGGQETVLALRRGERRLENIRLPHP